MVNQAQRSASETWTAVDVAGMDLPDAAAAVASLLRQRATTMLSGIRRRALRVIVVNVAALSVPLIDKSWQTHHRSRFHGADEDPIAGLDLDVADVAAYYMRYNDVTRDSRSELTSRLASQPRSTFYETLQSALSPRPWDAERLIAGLEVYAGPAQSEVARREVPPELYLTGERLETAAHRPSSGMYYSSVAYERLMKGLLRGKTGGLIPVSEVVEDDAGELTLAPKDRSAFFHVSFSDVGVAIGWSTAASLRVCFDALGGTAASTRPALAADMLEGGTAVEVTQRAEGIEETPFSVAKVGDVNRRIASLDPEGVLAYRVDVGRWSWEWDDFSRPDRPPSYRFGGLTESEEYLESIYPLVGDLGDEWVRANRAELWEQVRDFLGQRRR